MPDKQSGAVDPRTPGARLAHVAVIVPFFIVAALSSDGLTDNSFLWHIRAGEVQSAGRQVLTSDVFSFTAFGDAWRTQSWLVELGYFGLESTFGGLSWANWMVLFAASITLGLMGFAVYRSSPSPMATAFLLVLTVWLMGPFVQPRPVIFSYLLTAALVIALQHRDRLLWAVVPIMWLWAAVHGSWVIGGAYLVVELFRAKDRRILGVGVVSALATLLTAHGIGAWEIAVSFFGSRNTLAMMQEWQVPDFVNVVQGPFLLIIFGLIGAAMRGRITPKDFFVIVPFIILGMSSRRAVFPAAIVLIPYASLAVPPIPTSSSFRRGVVFAVGAVFALLVLLPMGVRPLGVLDEERFPSAELVEAFDGDRPFHGDGEGGYLIYADWPTIPVFIDDRAELYTAEAFADYQDVIHGDYLDVFEAWEIEVALSRAEWSLTEVLLDDGWTTRAETEHFKVLEPPQQP